MGMPDSTPAYPITKVLIIPPRLGPPRGNKFAKMVFPRASTKPRHMTRPGFPIGQQGLASMSSMQVYFSFSPSKTPDGVVQPGFHNGLASTIKGTSGPTFKLHHVSNHFPMTGIEKLVAVFLCPGSL